MNPKAEFIGTDQHSNLFSTLNRSIQAAEEEMAGATTGASIGSMGDTVHALAGGLIGAGLGGLAAGREQQVATGKRSSPRRKRVCVPGVWVTA